MKTALIALLLLIVLTCGCAGHVPAAESAVSPVPVTSSGTPGLLGTWTGPMQGYDEGSGFSEYPDFKVLMNITEQKGRIFAGTIIFIANGTTTTSGFAGVIGQDGRDLTITEQGGGYCTGEIVGTDEIELVYMHDGSPYSIAIDTFSRT